MTDFTPARIAELRALGAKATKLPYRQHLVDDTTIIAVDGTEIACTFPQGGIDDDVDFATDVEQKERDAAFLAAAANTLPAALDEIERLRAENDKSRACCGELREVTLAMNCATVNNTRTLAEAVAAMRAENERLREALRPFVSIASVNEDADDATFPDNFGYFIGVLMDDPEDIDLRLAHFRRARRALEGGEA
jgi:hypothetical protein